LTRSPSPAAAPAPSHGRRARRTCLTMRGPSLTSRGHDSSLDGDPASVKGRSRNRSRRAMVCRIWTHRAPLPRTAVAAIKQGYRAGRWRPDWPVSPPVSTLLVQTKRPSHRRGRQGGEHRSRGPGSPPGPVSICNAPLPSKPRAPCSSGRRYRTVIAPDRRCF